MLSWWRQRKERQRQVLRDAVAEGPVEVKRRAIAEALTGNQ
jgi:hypothetical protein